MNRERTPALLVAIVGVLGGMLTDGWLSVAFTVVALLGAVWLLVVATRGRRASR